MLSMMEVLHPISLFAVGIRRGTYRRLFGRRRLDWYVGLTLSASTDTGWKYWDDLAFPGRRPHERATEAVPTMPRLGYGASRLSSRRQGTCLSSILRPIVDDILKNGGYLSYEGALEDSLQACEVKYLTDGGTLQ